MLFGNGYCVSKFSDPTSQGMRNIPLVLMKSLKQQEIQRAIVMKEQEQIMLENLNLLQQNELRAAENQKLKEQALKRMLWDQNYSSVSRNKTKSSQKGMHSLHSSPNPGAFGPGPVKKSITRSGEDNGDLIHQSLIQYGKNKEHFTDFVLENQLPKDRKR